MAGRSSDEANMNTGNENRDTGAPISRAGNRRIKYLLGALVALVTMDALITQFLIKSGLGRETNPFLVSIVGGHLFIPLKVFGAALCALILFDIYRRWSKLALVATYCFVAIYGGIVTWNLAVFFVSNNA